MTSLAFTQRRLGENMACQSGVASQNRDNFDDTQAKLEDEYENNSSEKTLGLCDARPYSTGSESAHALHTLVDMALALEESSSRRTTDHTYALKDKCRKLPTEDTDKVSSEKDHTYASNTIGFRYSNHRSIHSQPRKSASEENLVLKNPPPTETSARKCTSTEEFVIPDQLQSSSDWSEQNFQAVGSNAATLPRSKVRTFAPTTYHDFSTGSPERAQTSPNTVFKSSPENSNCGSGTSDSDTAMEIPVKCDHTYAKFGANAKSRSLSKTDALASLHLLSSSAPGKLDRGDSDCFAHAGQSDHTYDKLSSAKRKDVLCKTVQTQGNTPTYEQPGSHSKHEFGVHAGVDASACAIAMDWQSQDHGQIFEKRFLPMDHTYTTVA